MSGVEAIRVTVEVDVPGHGLPGVTMVGLPDAAVRESRDRVRSAIRNSGFPFPGSHVTVSLAPADVRKIGAAFDLPIAIGILAASGLLPSSGSFRAGPAIFSPTIVGGLSLDGGVPPMHGLLPIAAGTRRAPAAALMFPAGNLPEAGIVDDVQLFPVASLWEAVSVLSAIDPKPTPPPRPAEVYSVATDDLNDVHGQLLARRALEVAAAGAHHLIFSGPPGAGKTMLARRLPGLLPPLSVDESIEVTTVHSVAGLLAPGSGLVTTRPFRAPHHTCSDVALVGGGTQPRPGEMSLAHCGVLFLDELPEFSRRVLETLRQPLELGAVQIARAARTITFPARVMLVAAMNPCPCGFLGDARKECRCLSSAVDRYRRRLSGPLRDRFDVSVDVQGVPWEELRGTIANEASDVVKTRVVAARDRQMARQGVLNAHLDGRRLRAACAIPDSADRLLSNAVIRLGLSARAVSRILRVARTIADLGGADRLAHTHVAEALQFRVPV